MSRGFDDGIGNIVREHVSGERNTPNPQEQAPGFYIGTVMDDVDDQFNGQVWVYIPAFSKKRFGMHSSPDYDGTTEDRQTGLLNYDQSLRLGWIQCMPLMPFYGSDAFRVNGVTDPQGRSATTFGDINAYGFWAQPRIGDQVGVLFANSDSARGFWIGGVAKHYSNFSVPSISGIEPSLVNSNSPLKSPTNRLPDDALVPALEKVRNDLGTDGRRFENVFEDYGFASNLLLAGIINDSLRGSGRSSARRESPSYVTGFKSPGWNFNSDKYHINAFSGEKFDGSAIGDPPNVNSTSRYRGVSTSGHQIAMDDHPDNQSIRIRTSAGSQVYFNDGGLADSAHEAFIYVSTAKGNVWMELQDDGDILVFGQGSFSLHAERDINLTADGEVNIEAGTNLNMKAGGNHTMDVIGTSNQKAATTLVSSAAYSINATGSMAFTSVGGVDLSAADNINITSASGMNMLAGTSASITAGVTFNVSAVNIAETAAGIASISAQVYRESAPGGIYMNSGPGQTASVATPATPAGVPTFPDLNKVPAAPTPEEIGLGQEPADTIEKLAPVVPQHQPYSERIKSTVGFTGNVEELVATEVDARRGSSAPNARTPLPIIGSVNGVSGRHVPQAYQSNNAGEAPVYQNLGSPSDGTLRPVSEYVTSTKMRNYIKKKESLVTALAYLDAGKAYAIGYGHNIVIGDTINGRRVDSAFLSELNRTNGRSLSITKAEADRIFDVDLLKFETGVKNNVTVELTQGQFDAMVSFSYNVGVSNFKNSTMLKRFNGGSLEDVPGEWMRWTRSQGVVQEGLTRRRRDELELFFSASDSELGVA